MSDGIVTKYLMSLIAKQVDDNGLVVWYDPDRNYTDVVKKLKLPDTEVICYEGSFIQLRWEIDQRKLMDGEEPPRLVVYVPMAQEMTHHALIELEVAGVVMKPGQQPPSRNTRLAVVARNGLKGVLPEEVVAKLVKQVEEGKLTLADLETLASKGGEISKGVISVVFGTGNSQDIALLFLSSDNFDESIIQKGAKHELVELMRKEFGFGASGGLDLHEVHSLAQAEPADLRHHFARYVLMTDFLARLGDAIPTKLSSVPVASTESHIEACRNLAKSWRERRDMRENYAAVARKIEQELRLDALELDPRSIEEVETFPIVEKILLQYVENKLLDKADDEILRLEESRKLKAGFWRDVDPGLSARWAIIVSIAKVLLEANRIEEALKSVSSLSITEMIREYTEGESPWCLLDTYYRHMESGWYNFEPYGSGDHDSMEKLVIKARQRYAQVGSEMAKRFLIKLQDERPGKDILRQQEVFEKYVKLFIGHKKVAYVWVDALRFEMGRELARLLKEDFQIDLHAAMAAVPTITEIGMAALLPGTRTATGGTARVVSAGGGKLALEIDGTIIKDRNDRVEFLKKQADVEVFDTKLDNLLPKPSKKVRDQIARAQLILVTAQEIDELCEQGNIAQARRQMDGVLNDIRRGLRVLADGGVQRIVLAADHGHLFLGEELSEDMKIEPPGGETIDLHRRVWVGRGGNADDAFLRLPISAFDLQGDFDIATPWTFACFRCKGTAKGYFHGGLSPQELLIPVMILSPLKKSSGGTPDVIKWKLIPGSQKLSTRFFSVQITGDNMGLFPIKPPKVRVELRGAKGKVISQTVSASYGFEEATGDVVLKNNEANVKKIEPNTVALMIIEEPNQNVVSLHLLDAVTGAELAQIDKIEVAILI